MEASAISLSEFKHTAKGARIAAILTTPAAIRAMVEKSERQRPAVEAVGARIAAEVGDLKDEERQCVGRWVKDLLAGEGLVPDRKGRVARGNLFARGTIYRRNSYGQPRAPAAERIAAARAILRASPHPIMSSDELIAERRREAAREA